MKGQQKSGRPLGLWEVAALVATGLLLALFSVAIGLLLFQSTGG